MKKMKNFSFQKITIYRRIEIGSMTTIELLKISDAFPIGSEWKLTKFNMVINGIVINHIDFVNKKIFWNIDGWIDFYQFDDALYFHKHNMLVRAQ